ncbi:MAG: hypothetical protein O7F76_04865 [Planctomycetota bacterium]|nr:hypothetical protein [Planctomycetota bacterium]
MAKQSVGFVDKHIEKVVLGACVFGLVGIVILYFVQNPYGSSPGKSFEEVLLAADSTRNKVKIAAPPLEPTNDPSGPDDKLLRGFQIWFDPDKRVGLIEIAGIEKRAARVQQFPTPLLPVAETADSDRHGLARIDAPGIPIVMSGTSTFDIPPVVSLRQIIEKGQFSGDSFERSWVSVGAQVLLKDLLRDFLAAGYKRGQLGLVVAGVDLQRRVVGRGGGEWEFVDTYLPFVPPSRPRLTFDASGTIEVSASKKKERFLNRIRHPIAQQLIRGVHEEYSAPPLTEGVRGDKFRFPQLPVQPLRHPDGPTDQDERPTNPNTRARALLSRAKKAMEGRSPYDVPDPDAASLLSCSALGVKRVDAKVVRDIRKFLDDEVAPQLKKLNRPPAPAKPPDIETLMPIVALDLNVVAGRTYEYRIRYEVYNHFAGNTDILKDPADASKLTLWSDWSPPSRKVDVKSDIEFFISNVSRRKKDQVQVAVYKTSRANQVDQRTFSVQVGDAIGGPGGGKTKGVDFSTGMICVDLDFDAKVDGANDVAMAYVNKTDGTLWVRYFNRDKSDPRLQDLKRKAR